MLESLLSHVGSIFTAWREGHVELVTSLQQVKARFFSVLLK